MEGWELLSPAFGQLAPHPVLASLMSLQSPLPRPPQLLGQPCPATCLQLCRGRRGRRQEEGVGAGWPGLQRSTSLKQKPAMSSLGLLLLLLLLARPLSPSSLPPLDTPEGKATIASLILSALERATSFLEKRLPEINLDGVVGFRVLEGGCALVPLDWPPGKPVLSLSPACSVPLA